MAEIRFNARGEQFELGQVAWTRQLYGALASGSYIRQKYGQSPVIEKTPYQVKIRHASQDWTCRTCGQKIDEGDMHGSTFYDHYCLDCVTRSKPETEVEFLKPEVAPIKLYRTTRGFEEDAALRADLETKQGYKLYAVFDTPEEAQEVAKKLAGQDIKFVKHISTPETGEHQTWEIYAKPIPQADLYWYSISELKQMCREGGLSTEGSKEQLITRLKRA